MHAKIPLDIPLGRSLDRPMNLCAGHRPTYEQPYGRPLGRSLTSHRLGHRSFLWLTSLKDTDPLPSDLCTELTRLDLDLIGTFMSPEVWRFFIEHCPLLSEISFRFIQFPKAPKEREKKDLLYRLASRAKTVSLEMQYVHQSEQNNVALRQCLQSCCDLRVQMKLSNAGVFALPLMIDAMGKETLGRITTQIACDKCVIWGPSSFPSFVSSALLSVVLRAI